MISSIIKFELKNRFKQWTTLLLYGLLIFQGIWYTKGTFDYYVNEDMLMNAPAIFYKNLAGGGVLMVIIVAVITGPTIYKEVQYKTGGWLFAHPIDEKKFLLGRFVSAYLINLLVALGYVIGMILVPYAGIGEAHRFGDIPIGQLLHGYAIYIIPNLLLLTAAIYFSIVYFRKMAAGYLAVLITVMSFLLMQTAAEGSGATPFLMIADPFSFVATDYTISFMSPEQKNTGYISLNGYLLYNRILWLCVSIALILATYFRFNFKAMLRITSKRKKKMEAADKVKPVFNKQVDLAEPQLAFTVKNFVKKLFSLSVLEFKNVVRPTGFKVILGIILLMALGQNLLWNASYYVGPTHALTFVMTSFRLSFGVFIIILLMVWATELFFKDRTVNFWQIADAMPVPVWVVTVSRFLAMVGVAFVLNFAFMLMGVFSQLIKGSPELIDINLYAYDFLGYNWGWLTHILYMALAFFIAGITGKRFLTHILSVGFFFALIMAYELNLAEQTIYAYGAVPGLEDYSEISGYGIWNTSAKWYFSMWLVLGAALVLIGIQTWNRGTSRKWTYKFAWRNKQLHPVSKLVVVVLIAGFFVLQSFIIGQVNGLGNFEASALEEEHSANYEKEYAHLKEKEHPKYKHVDMNMALFPEKRRAEYTTVIELRGSVQDTLFLNYSDFVEVTSIELNGQKLIPALDIPEYGLVGYPVSNIVENTNELKITAIKQYVGFTQSGEQPQPDLMHNGSFGEIKDFLPVIGYDYARELTENRKREEHNLARLDSRSAELRDPIAIGQDAFAPDANWVSGTIQISTSIDQVAIAPGKLEKEWEQENRNHFIYTVNEPAPFNWHIGSAVYHKETRNLKSVETTILADTKHQFNLNDYFDAIEKAIIFVNDKLGQFPIDQLRVVEIPYYQDNFYSYPNVIAISEKEGWYADMGDLEEQAYIYQSVASQVIKQWLYRSVNIPNVQGADMLQIALPEALSLQFLRETKGEEAMALILQKKSDLYAKNRFNESNKEPALIFADGADYLEVNKGAVELYRASEHVGFNVFNDIVTSLIHRHEKLTFMDVYKTMEPHLDEDLKKAFLEVD